MRHLSRKRRLDSSSKNTGDPKSMCKITLTKTTGKFFSERGNNRLKRIWLDNNLDDEMIFSSWIGPSEAILHQKVSDYLQAFLLRRSNYVPVRGTEMLALLRRFSTHCELTHSADGEGQHDYFAALVHNTLQRRYEERENAEKLRIENSIAKNDLPIISGYEYVSNDPIFRVEQLEKRMKNLRKIPFPYNQEDFEKHILPIMTSLAIEEERKAENRGSHKRNFPNESSNGTTSKLRTALSDDSGVTSNRSCSPDLDSSTDTADYDNELVQIFSEMDLTSKDVENNLDDTLSDVCEVCGGLHSWENNEALTCTCVSDPIWSEKHFQTASSMFVDASKIIDLHTMKHELCDEYMKQYYFNSWAK